ncbi:unnamed protein product [Echinostoma caproni]|uniref:Uncharacterized protein n=1 Tax=Echinostoma caproni TaxID=27848 RepID=A0A183A761_9TREM|nr:unnamed protein product [Echinostoma caproni]
MEPHRVIRVHRPETLSAQYKNGFGETHGDDRPWPRGEVIYAGRGSPMQNGSPNHWKPGFRGRLNGGGPRQGPPHNPGYNQYQYYGQPPRRPYRQGYRGRRKSGYQRPGGGGMCSAWNGSMPYGLHNCGYQSHRSFAHIEDGFIDDTLVSDLSQFSLHDDPFWDRDALLYQTGNSHLAQQTRTLAKDCASTPYLATTTTIGTASRPKSFQTRMNKGREIATSSSISPAATSDASNPVDRLCGLGDQSETTESTSSPEPNDPLDTLDLEHSPGSLSEVRAQVAVVGIFMGILIICNIFSDSQEVRGAIARWSGACVLASHDDENIAFGYSTDETLKLLVEIICSGRIYQQRWHVNEYHRTI